LVAKKEEALKRLEAEPAKAGKDEKKYERRKSAAVKAVVEANKKNKARLKRFKERIMKAEAALDKAREARERAGTGYEERLERAELQLKLARETRDYNLNTSLKNYIDPREYRKWGEKVGYDWTRLYTTALRRKFKWAEQEGHARHKKSAPDRTAEPHSDGGDEPVPALEQQPVTANAG
jgi:DNA topoisomerase-1